MRLCLLQARETGLVARLVRGVRLTVGGVCIEEIDLRASRALGRHVITQFAGFNWMGSGYTVRITGATGQGLGKTWLACGPAQQEARSGLSVLYVRAPRLLDELRIAHGDGSFGRRVMQLARIDVC